MPQIINLLTDDIVHKKIDTLCKQLVDIDSISKRLQDPCRTLLDACLQFDGIKDCFLSVRTMHNCLGENAEIVENLKFESALVEEQDWYEHKLTAAKEKLCSANSILFFSVGGPGRQ